MSFRTHRSSDLSIASFEPMILMSASGFVESFGTAGNDVLTAESSGELLEGGCGDDILIGRGGNNTLNGGHGDDTLISYGGRNVLNGGEGFDLAVYASGRRADFTVVRQGADGLIIGNCQRQDFLTGVEAVRFTDGEFTIAELLGCNGDPIPDPTPSHEYRTIDGTNNNPYDAEIGSTHEDLLRLATAEYGDGVSTPAGADRPSAREISNTVSAQTEYEPNDRGMTDYVWMWGQFLDHDIDLTDGAVPTEEFNIPVPTGDPYFDPAGTGTQYIGLTRSVYDPEADSSEPRQQINAITSYIDGSNVYGSDDVRAAELRTFEGGRLKMSDGDLLPFNSAGLPNAGGTGDELFLAGDVRANENAVLSSIHTLWVREHNRIADELSVESPWLSDEQIYQQAREIVIAELQVITYNEFLPALLGDGAITEYAGYNPYVDPSIANEFSTAAFRVGHTLLTSDLQRLNNDGSVIDAGNLSLKDAFFAPAEVVAYGIDPFFKGAATQAANEVDTQVIDDVRNFLFGPPGAGGFDLPSLNIQRGRDHGLADYNTVRVSVGLNAVSDFDEITSDVDLQTKLRDLYGSVDNIDLWIGGLAEDHVAGSSLGETFRIILVDQFTRLRDGDRFWYENVLEADILAEVKSTTLADVIERNTTVRGLQENVFFLADAQPKSSEQHSYEQLPHDSSGQGYGNHSTLGKHGLVEHAVVEHRAGGHHSHDFREIRHVTLAEVESWGHSRGDSHQHRHQEHRSSRTGFRG